MMEKCAAVMRKHIFESAEFLGEVLYELDDVIQKQYLQVAQEADCLDFVDSSCLYEPCRYTRDELWSDDILWQMVNWR